MWIALQCLQRGHVKEPRGTNISGNLFSFLSPIRWKLFDNLLRLPLCQREPHPDSVKKRSTLKTKHWTFGWQHRLLRRPETKQLITAGVNYWGTSKERPWKGMRKLIPTWNNMSNVRCWRRKTFDFSLRSVISWSLQITKVAPPVSRLSVVQKATTFQTDLRTGTLTFQNV